MSWPTLEVIRTPRVGVRLCVLACLYEFCASIIAHYNMIHILTMFVLINMID